MPTASKPVIFAVRAATSLTRAAGITPPLPRSIPNGVIKHSVRIASTRGEGETVALDAVPGRDVVVLQIADGPELVLHPEHARDLLLAQDAGDGARAGTTAAAAAGQVPVPARLQWSGMTETAAARGVTRSAGGVLISAMHVVTGAFSGSVKNTAAQLVALQVVRKMDGQVNPGVYQLSPDALVPLKAHGTPLAAVPAPPTAGAPLLVLVHGTFSTTAGTFVRLWLDHPDQVRAIFARYEGRVYGLDHPTLAVSPIANALFLAQRLPDGARLHLLTHSRGGLVAETLARACDAAAGSTARELAAFAGAEYVRERAELKELLAVVRRKKIAVDRVVRVACPARGTLLASKRIDAYVSIFKWTLELAGLPIAAEILDFLSAVAQQRADWTRLPGLAAQIPDSALVQWLHQAADRIDGQLRVVAGDLQGDSLSSWLKVLVTDAFYWTDHDLVVQTRSMYGGAPRRDASTFLLDRGGKVTHFEYFANERTARAIAAALTQDAPQDFAIIGPLSWAGESATGTRAAVVRRTRAGAAARPAVFVLPGILGSNLRIGDDRIWISWRLVNGFARLTFTGKRDNVEPDGLIGSSYNDLSTFLSMTHDVVEFPFDWRRPIESEARRLADAVDAALTARATTSAPVRIVAHSMGGLVARVMELERPKVWERMLAREGGRLLMLGTPNGGSFAPMQVLSGDDSFGNLISIVGAPFRQFEARREIAGFPGLLQMQAGLLDPNLGLNAATRWQELADDDLARAKAHASWHSLDLQLNELRWGVPAQAVLDAALKLRRRLDGQIARLAAAGDRLVLVVGEAPFTPSGIEMTGAGLVYVGGAGGDGRVTAANAELPQVRTWRVACDHGQLPKQRAAFGAYQELLTTGTTALIESVATETTRARTEALPPVLVKVRPARTARIADPPRTEEEALGTMPTAEAPVGAAAAPPLRVSVINGDLTFVRHPLLLGHYRSSRLTGTERVMNRWIGDVMNQSLRVGTYPDAIGSSQIFINHTANPRNPLDLPRPQAVIVTGLGEEGKLRGTDLVRTVRQAVLAWAERRTDHPETRRPPRQPDEDAGYELATTLIGSGGSGISAGQAAQLIAQAVSEANQRLAGQDGSSAHPDGASPRLDRVSRLHIIELYLDRATEALRALQLLSSTTPGRYVVDPVVESHTGGLPRPVDASYRGADYDFISAITGREMSGSTSIQFTLDTKRARTEVTAQRTQPALLRNLIASASNDTNADPKIGQTLFQLVVPIELEPYLTGSSEMQIELDDGTAGIPWELLDAGRDAGSDSPGAMPTAGAAADPWAIRTKLLRKLRIADAPVRKDAGVEGSALVIGEPEADPDRYPRLFGARDEARQVTQALTAALSRERVTALISPADPSRFGPDAPAVLNALFDRDHTWRIVHITGHGEPTTAGQPGGVVLSQGFLSAAEISTLRVVPELVFVDCCYLAARTGDQLLSGTYDRASFAASVADELIRIGVRCVIAAGWAVDDAAAATFATTFYTSLLQNRRRFLDAVGDARKAAYACGGNTWAAYQCYGDPDWTFHRDPADPQRPSLADEYRSVLSAADLARALETLRIQSQFQGAAPPAQRDKIRYLAETTKRSAEHWLQSGHVAEAFARAALAADDPAGAVRWFEAALAAEDATASLKAAEDYWNLRSRIAAEQFADGEISADDARTQITSAIDSLQRLIALDQTAEREDLCGSAYKRLALVEAAARQPQAETAAIQEMEAHYAAAQARSTREARFYPALNRLAAQLALHAGTSALTVLDPAIVLAIEGSLEATRDDRDFFSAVAGIELGIYQAVATGTLAASVDGALAELATLHERVKTTQWWKSVRDTAEFVLAKYRARASASEQASVDTLLSQLSAWAATRPAGAPATAVPPQPSRRAARARSRKTQKKARRPRR